MIAPHANGSIDIKDINASIHASLKYIVRHLNADGRYTYLYDPLSFNRTSEYNILRHAGTTEVLFRCIGTHFDSSAIATKAQGPLAFLLKTLAPDPRPGRGGLCPVEDGVTKLGGAALTLLALATALEKVDLTLEHTTALRALARYIADQQKSDGSFVLKRTYRTGEEIPFVSRYYPGQAILALCAAFRHLHELEFLDRAKLAAKQILASGDVSGADHWIMMALASLYLLDPNTMWKIGLEERSLTIICDLSEQLTTSRPKLHATTTQVATRIEGLVAALTIESQHGRTRQAIGLAMTILAALQWCYQMQVRPHHMLYPDARSHGGFTQSPTATVIRIDYVQHGLAASLGGLLALDVATSTRVDPHDD